MDSDLPDTKEGIAEDIVMCKVRNIYTFSPATLYPPPFFSIFNNWPRFYLHCVKVQ